MSHLTPQQESKKKQDQEQQVVIVPQKILNRTRSRRTCCIISIVLFFLLLLVLIILAVVLSLTLFKPKEPKTQLISATLQGISPKLTFPAIDIQINVTLDLKILIHNRNHASFKHQQGKSVLLYESKQVGETEISPGLIPSRGSETIPCRLTLQADELASNVTGFVGDLMGGEISMETVTEIPGKVTFLGFIKKHVVAKSNCFFTFGFPDLEIKSQTCKSKTKL